MPPDVAADVRRLTDRSWALRKEEEILNRVPSETTSAITRYGASLWSRPGVLREGAEVAEGDPGGLTDLGNAQLG
jgi:hypothetical protein